MAEIQSARAGTDNVRSSRQPLKRSGAHRAETAMGRESFTVPRRGGGWKRSPQILGAGDLGTSGNYASLVTPRFARIFSRRHPYHHIIPYPCFWPFLHIVRRHAQLLFQTIYVEVYVRRFSNWGPFIWKERWQPASLACGRVENRSNEALKMNSRGEEVHDNFSTMLSLQNFSTLYPCQEGRDMTRCRQWFSMVFHLSNISVGWSNDVLNPDISVCRN